MIVSRRLGLGALVLGAAAPFAGSPYRSLERRRDTDAIVKAITDGSDHVSARELAAWMRDRKPGLRVIDVREAAAFAEYSIPGAVNLPIDRLLHTAFTPGDTLVLYSEEGAHAGQAWVLLRITGVANVVFIPGGLADWQEEVMSPMVPTDLSPERRSEITELSRYFGGSPRFGGTGEATTQPTPRRRGC